MTCHLLVEQGWGTKVTGHAFTIQSSNVFLLVMCGGKISNWFWTLLPHTQHCSPSMCSMISPNAKNNLTDITGNASLANALTLWDREQEILESPKLLRVSGWLHNLEVGQITMATPALELPPFLLPLTTMYPNVHTFSSKRNLFWRCDMGSIFFTWDSCQSRRARNNSSNARPLPNGPFFSPMEMMTPREAAKHTSKMVRAFMRQ